MYSLSSNGEYFATDKLRLKHGFTTKKAGTNRDWAEQQQFFQRYLGENYPNYSFITPYQVHGARVLTLRGHLRAGHTVCPGYDGLLYSQFNKRPVCLFVKSADCLTLLIESTKKDLIGAVHLGWQGSLAGIILELGEKLKLLGVNNSEIRVALGPSINDCCYNIPIMRAELFETKYPSSRAIFKRGKQYYFSLPRFAMSELLKLGFLEQNISYRANCTFCQSDLYFSHRHKPEVKEHLLSFICSHE
jgi:YfiH family protein